MASYSGNSSGSGEYSSVQLQNSGSEGDLQQVMDQRKRKRMQSNRESARRSRMRKQKHLDDLMAQVNQLKKDNGQILANINITTQRFMSVEADNLILRAQMAELSQRLNSLNDILSYMHSINNNGIYEEDTEDIFQISAPVDSFMTSFNNLQYLNQPIMASADMFHC